MPDADEIRRLDEHLRAEGERTQRLVASLAAELDEIIASIDLSNNDDEHDPDGSTNGYERAKSTSLLHQAEATLAEIDAARARLDDGSYGTCERCGEAIGDERLAALPTTTTCTACATGGAPGPLYR